MQLFKLECKRLFAGYINKSVLILFVVAGLFAIYQGAQGYKSIRVDQYKSQVVFQKEREHVSQRETLPEAGSLAYYASSPTQWQLGPWAALFVGESRTAMAALKVSALSLQSQIYNREFINPTQQRAGGLDLGFVLVYLLPLVIGILTVTLISDEQHAGRWRMLNALPKSAFSLIIKQLLLRFVVIWGLVAGLLFAAAWALAIKLDALFAFVLIACTVYMLFWFALAAWLMSLGKSSVFNSLAFLSSWVLLAILIPGAIHLFLSQQFNSNTPLQITLQQRMTMNDGWDKDKQAALDTFLKHKPTWQNTAPLGEAFDWKWYFAQQHLSDIAVEQAWQSYLQNLDARQTSLNNLSKLSPTLFFQLKLNQLANTTEQDRHSYLKEVAHYHQQVRHYFYDFLFFAKPISKIDIENFPLFQAKQSAAKIELVALLSSALLVLIVAALALFRLRRVSPM